LVKRVSTGCHSKFDEGAKKAAGVPISKEPHTAEKFRAPMCPPPTFLNTKGVWGFNPIVAKYRGEWAPQWQQTGGQRAH